MIVKEVLARVVIFEQRSEEDEGANHAYSMGKSDPGRGTSKCKNPEPGVCPVHTSVYVEVKAIEDTRSEKERRGWVGKGF